MYWNRVQSIAGKIALKYKKLLNTFLQCRTLECIAFYLIVGGLKLFCILLSSLFYVKLSCALL